MIDGSGKVSPQIACAGTWGKTAATQIRGRPECAKRVRIVGVHSEVEDKGSVVASVASCSRCQIERLAATGPKAPRFVPRLVYSCGSTWPLQANKKTFVSQLAEVERREALSILGAQRSRRARKRARRGFGFCAAQSCTSGIDRRSRSERQTSP